MFLYLITFLIFLLVIASMSIGYIIQCQTISGSCGGLSSVGIKKICNCPEPCDARKKREARAAKTEGWKNNKIL
ncbi:(Na+)-NQR maturation NqrM [Candidatus Enterovibrio altilux]|nr:(Na+)-NQR maturation NqrM [Candidatus Enterovibrio luxaltus]